MIKPADLIRVGVSDVRTAVPSSPGLEAGLVVLTETSSPYRVIEIVIGQPEARAIHAAWTGSSQRRPSTWDLFASAIGLLGGRLVSVVITAVEDGVRFYSDLEMEVGEERKLLSARPSDAIALALRASEAEILVAKQVLTDLGLDAPPEIDN